MSNSQANTDENEFSNSATSSQTIAPATVVKKVLLIGLAVSIVIGLLDNFVLGLANQNQWKGWTVYLAFAVFVLQTAFVAGFVGLRSENEPAWWVFFFWSLLQVNLLLILIGANSSAQYQSAFVFSFLTAQVGTVIFWAMIDTTSSVKRLVIGFSLFVLCCYPFWFDFFHSMTKGWIVMMAGYIVASFLACGILRLCKFRLRVIEDRTDANADNNMQFSITHLFIWMIVVAVLMAIGRIVEWEMLGRYFAGTSVASLVCRAVLMTLITVVTAWTVMGNLKAAWIRVLVLLFVLTSVGVGLAFIDQSGGWWQLGGRFRWGATKNIEALLQTWVTWALLNGLFISSLLLLFRVSGNRLVRRVKFASAA